MYTMDMPCLSNTIQDLKVCSAQADTIINDFMNKSETSFSEWFTAIKELALDVKNGVIQEKEANGKMENKLPELNTLLDRQQNVDRRFANLMSEMKREHLHEKKASGCFPKITSNQTETRAKKNEATVQVCVKKESNIHNSPAHNLRRSSRNEEKKVDNLEENIEKSTPQEKVSLSPLRLRSGKTPGSENRNISSDAEKNTKGDVCYKTPVMRTAIIDSSTHSVSVLKHNPKSKSVLLAIGRQSKRKSTELNETITKESTKRKKINNCRLPTTQSTEKLSKKNQEPYSLSKTSLYQGSFLLGSQTRNQKSSVSGLTSLLLKPSTQNPKKEVELLKEIQKKEEKANENLKKVQSLRQMKVEENKKKRQEKMEKTLQQRLKMEKQKEERLKNHKNSVEFIGQKGPSVKNPSLKLNRVMNITDNQQEYSSKIQVKNQQKSPTKIKTTPEETCKPLQLHNNNALKDQSQIMNKIVTANIKGGVSCSNSQTPGLNTTYVADNPELTAKTNMKKANETKALSELSFVNYEISKDYVSDNDDDEEEKCMKPIPSWAKGMVFKNALLIQHHHPPKLDTLFGIVIDPPDLTDIFGPKEKYKKRTSSAIWNSPNRPFFP